MDSIDILLERYVSRTGQPLPVLSDDAKQLIEEVRCTFASKEQLYFPHKTSVVADDLGLADDFARARLAQYFGSPTLFEREESLTSVFVSQLQGFLRVSHPEIAGEVYNLLVALKMCRIQGAVDTLEECCALALDANMRKKQIERFTDTGITEIREYAEQKLDELRILG